MDVLLINSTSDQEEANEPSEYGADPISDDVISLVYLAFSISAHGFVSLIGSAMNLCNIIVLAKMGFPNANSICVFALSITDFLVTVLQLAMCICYFPDEMSSGEETSLRVIGNFELGWIRYACFFISGWITALLSLERCCCVVMPFTVKILFTKSRIKLAVVIFYASYTAFILPFYIVQKLSWQTFRYVDTQNVTQVRYFLVFEYTEEFILLQTFIISIGVVALFFLCQIILVICTVVMIYALRESSKSRHSILRHDVSKTPTFSLSAKERRLILVTLGLAVISTACNLPRFADHVMRYVMPGMASGMYANLSGLLWAVSDVSGTLNCSCSFCVYWTLNHNFRRCLFQMISKFVNRTK
uniref:G-protein coupled receptors family 1 profile domain-containing protein n=1 Tax=Biomphalaria glabrata TaxID=6526 RepID=A0A2C9M8R8_BIOGL